MRFPAQLFIAAASCASLAEAKRLMTWMCLEFCEDSPEMITDELAQLALVLISPPIICSALFYAYAYFIFVWLILQHKDLVSAVSFEKYTLGPDSTLVDNHLTEVSEYVKK